MRLNKLPVLILNDENEKIALDYINNKIIYLVTSSELKRGNVYLINVKGRYSKKGRFIYKKIELINNKSLGEFDIDSFIIKMQLLYNSPVSTFKEIINYDKHKYSLHLVRFSGTELRRKKEKYNLKMGRRFANVLYKKEYLEENIRNEYSGYALIEKICLANRKYDIYNAISLFGDFKDKAKYEKLDKFKNDYDEDIDINHYESYRDLDEDINPRYYEVNENEPKYVDYGMYESELDYEPNLDDYSGYQANELYHEALNTINLTDDGFLITHENDDLIRKNPRNIDFSENMNQNENDIDVVILKKTLNFIKRYKIIEIDRNNIFKLIDFYTKFDIIREKMKKHTFYQILGRILFYINFVILKGEKAIYKISNIDDLKFAIDYKKYNLLEYSIDNINRQVLDDIFSYDYENIKEVNNIGKNGINIDDISKNLEWIEHKYTFFYEIPF
jgi:hypothetical protein